MEIVVWNCGNMQIREPHSRLTQTFAVTSSSWSFEVFKLTYLPPTLLVAGKCNVFAGQPGIKRIQWKRRIKVLKRFLWTGSWQWQSVVTWLPSQKQDASFPVSNVCHLVLFGKYPNFPDWSWLCFTIHSFVSLIWRWLVASWMPIEAEKWLKWKWATTISIRLSDFTMIYVVKWLPAKRI